MLIYLLRLDNNVGLMVDDSWYALLAKAISEGHGYHLINSTAPLTTPLYPPGYPAILSLIWSFNPNFPNNVIALKVVSLIALALTWKLLLHLNRQYLQASDAINWLTTTAVMLTPLLVYYATSTLMSECIFLLLQTFVIVLCYRAETSANKQWLLVIAIGSVAGIASLIRIAGIVLVFAGIFTFLFKRKFGAAAIILILGFLPVGIWSLTSPSTTPIAPEEQSNYVANDYLFHFLRKDENVLTSPNVTTPELAQRIAHNFTEISTSSFGQIFLPYLSPKRFLVGAVLSLLVAAFVFLGLIQSIRERPAFISIYFVISLLLILGWGFSPTRFLAVLMPISLQYFVIGIGWLAEKFAWQKTRLQLLTISFILAGFIGIHLAMISAKYDLFFGALLKNKFAMFAQQRNLEAVIEWTKKNIPTNEVIATDVPALIFLHTNRRAVHLINPEKDQELWRKLGIRHLVLSGITTTPAPTGFQIVFSTNDQKAVICEIQ